MIGAFRSSLPRCTSVLRCRTVVVVVVVFFREHPYTWNFNFTISVDAVRVKLYMYCLFGPIDVGEYRNWRTNKHSYTFLTGILYTYTST